MKICYGLMCVLCLLFSGCSFEKSVENQLIEYNLRASYPSREIKLEEVADIEYLQLEFDDDFLFSVNPDIITTDKIFIGQRSTGDILVFSRNGKPLSKFNHSGNGPEDYINLSNGLLYDDFSDEIYVISGKKIMVYASSGEFKRYIPLLRQPGRTNDIVNYDSNTFLLYDRDFEYDYYNTDQDVVPFVFISKEDGSVVEAIGMPTDKKVPTYVFEQYSATNANVFRGPTNHIVRHNDGYLLTNFSIDTVYFLSAEKKMLPILVRQPNIQSMNPVVYLNSFVEAGGYEFVSVVTVRLENLRLPITYLMRDRKTGSIYRQKITFNDYKGKEVHISPETITNTQDSKLGLIVFGLVELQDANRENKLSGKLKELVENSDEDGNPIYMLLHFK